MTIDVIIPRLGEAVDTMTLIEWHKGVSDTVTEGDVLFEVDVDKAVVEIPAIADGVLIEILVEADTEVVPLQVVGRLQVSGDVT